MIKITKRISGVLLVFLLSSYCVTAQVFWTETFSSACGSLCQLPYAGLNGSWTWVSTGTNGAAANTWFVSQTEGGMGRNVCGASGPPASLHIGNVSTSPAAFFFCPTGDCGAAYDASSGAPSDVCHARATSPVINCTGKTGITVGFNYILGGEAGHDYVTVDYFDGSLWTTIATPAMTALCGFQGKWTHYTVALPASANNNPSVQIGFNWQNDNNNKGNDPSVGIDSVTLSVAVSPPPVAAFTCVDSTICVGDSVHFIDKSSNSPTSWKWTLTGGSPSTSTLQNPVVYYGTAGTYTVKEVVKNVNGSDSITKVNYITVLPLPTITISGTTTICAGNSTTLTATGGGTYAWSTGAATAAITVSPGTTTTYSLTVTNGGCPKDTTVKVTVTPLPTVTLSGNNSLCPGDSTTLTATGGGTYAWSNGSTKSSITVKPVTTTTYTLGVTNGGCTKDTSITVTVASKPTASISNDTTICAGATLTLTASGGTSYSWSNGATTSSITVTPGTNITYTVSVSNGGCPADTAVTVTVNPVPTVTLSGTNVICSGKSTTITATGGGTYSWSNGATTSSITVTPGTSTTYSVSVANGGCPKDTTFTVTVNPSPAITLSGNMSICAGDSTTLTAGGGGTYNWSNGSTNGTIIVKPAADSTLTLQVTTGGCTSDTTITIIVNAQPIPLVGPLLNTCQGTPVQLTASGGTSYSWQPASSLSDSSLSNPMANPAVTTTYTVIVANGGCTATDSETVVVYPVSAVAACCTATITQGQSAPLTVSPVIPGDKYQWVPSAGVSCDTCPSTIASPSVTTWYHVIVTDSNNCTSVDSVLITVKENCGAVFVPDAFSPNGDGQNDILYVMCNPACVSGLTFNIYDRWGNLIFKTSDPAVGWDGTYHGKPMNTGTYVYILKYTDDKGSAQSGKGNIALVR